MEPQAASRHISDTSGNANGVKGSNVRYFASSAGPGIKREMVDDHPKDGLYIAKSHQSPRDNNNGLVAMSTTSSQYGNHKLRGQQRFSPPETDVCAWLRDEPVDTSTGGLFQSGSDSALGNSLSGGSGGTDSNLELGGGHFVTDGSNGLPGFNATGGLTDEGAQRKGLGSMSTSSLYAQLRATKIKESILLEGIQRLGGGQKGLRGVIKAIMFWLEAKNRHNLQSGDPCISHSELPSPRLDDIDQFPWSNFDSGSVVDGSHGQVGQQQQQQHFGGQNLVHVNSNNGRSSSAPADLSCLMNSTSTCRDSDVNGSLCAGDRGSGEYCGQVQPNYESQQQPVSAFIGMQSHGSGPGAAAGGAHRNMSSGDWVAVMREDILPPEKVHRSRTIRKLSPSSDDSGMHSTNELVASFDDALSQERQQGKIRRHSRTAGYSTSSQSSSVSSEFPAYLNSSTPPVPEVLGAQAIFGAVGANPFAPGGAFNPTSPASADPHSLDFNAFGTQGSILVDESLGLGGSVPGCGPIDRFGSLGCPLSPEQPLDRKASGTRLGVVSRSKASPAACTRLARKQRMDRNRKAALYQVNRGAFENNGLFAGKSGGSCSPGSLRSICRSQGSPASDGPTGRTIDRRDQENLQFLLLKVLRPSDVGNLGRIVLPKKDAESHLPWLGAREGVQFTCEDYDTGEMMTMRYRFWPNNKSRMYLLENTGDFVKKHHLQESDRMLIYRNQKQGTYIIRARKAHDCVDGLPNLDRTEDMNEDIKDITEQNSPGGPCSSGTSSLSGTESSPGSGQDGGSESGVPVPVITTSQDDVLNFTDLPDAPMGEGTENLVRFPSLESFDVELLELASANKQEVTSCVGNINKE